MSENFITTDTFADSVFDASVAPLEPDIVNSSLDSLKVGMHGMTAEQLQQWLGLNGSNRDTSALRPSTGRLTNLNVADVRRILTAVESKHDDTGPVAFRRVEPYEFRLLPITGANPLGLPEPGGIQLPLPPEKFGVSREQQARTFVAINGVEYSLPGPQSLASLSIEGMLPAWPDGARKPNYLPGYVTRDSYRHPKDLAATFERIQKKGQPLELTIGPHATGATLNKGGRLIGTMYVTITAFVYEEAFGHVGDYVFSMQLKEWRPIFPRPQVQASDSTPAAVSDPAPTTGGGDGGIGIVPPGTPPPLPPPLTNHSPATNPDVNVYVVKAGDTLFDIAARLLGSGTRWTQIYALNKKTIEDECKRRGSSNYPRGWHIWPGTKLKIPPKGQRDAS